MTQSLTIVFTQAAECIKYVLVILLAGNIFCSNIYKSYVTASYNFDLHAFLITLSNLTRSSRYMKVFATLMQELVSNDDLTNFPITSLCITIYLVSHFFYTLMKLY